MKLQGVLVILVILLMSINVGCENKRTQQMQKLTHQTGFTLSVPADIKYQATSNGYILFPPGGRELRSPIEIKVTYSKEAMPAGQFDKTKKIEGDVVHYRMEEVNGGSGGTEYTIQAWKPLSTGYLIYEQLIQMEPPEKPDFELFWKIVSVK